MRIPTSIVVAAALAMPAVAQRRDLPVPLDKGWKHEATGIILNATLDGLPRTKLTDYGTAERDVAAEFATADHATIATVYVFHPGLMSVPIWFDRARAAIELRDVYGGVIPLDASPAPTPRPGGNPPAGLRQTYVPRRSPLRSTALAVVPAGAWLVTVRLSSTMLDPPAANTKLTAILAAIRWPAGLDYSPEAVPVQPCADGLPFKKAKLKKPDMMQALLGGTLALAAAKKSDAPRVVWCRDPVKATVAYGVYRGGGSKQAFTVAIADSGRVAGVSPAIDLLGQPSTGGYAVSYTDLDGTVATFPSFDRLPLPEQVVDLVLGGQGPIARTGVDGSGKSTVMIGLPK